MSEALKAVLQRRAGRLEASLARHRLVFLQLGSSFRVLRSDLLELIADTVVSVEEVLAGFDEQPPSTIAICNVESLSLAANGSDRLSALRERSLRLLDNGHRVCLVSTAPRVAFGSVPGSSLLEDASLALLDFLDESELSGTEERAPLWHLPEASFGEQDGDLMEKVLGELGTGVLSALDHCLFEIDPRSSNGLSFLSIRETEALRGAGLIVVSSDGGIELANRRSLAEIKAAVAHLLGTLTDAPAELAAVSSGLWFIERTMRSALRRHVSQSEGERWRVAAVGGLATEVLKRAQLDSSLSAVSVRELRDPLEWLTLSELLDVITSTRIGGLGVASHIWQKFREQVLPVRNRLSHMRLLKSRDEETVSIWVGVIRQTFR
ncbi:hypothetical protein FHU33_3179 [Blastococcus colisei]|uniref:Uncharacterized protein n=1 Tax=Blastococcus colisei TaxID=1564162 RepID=A0A543PI03_9ACTN|nr:hypothetical protein FHU33_3179 [Blastococcus colisei]